MIEPYQMLGEIAPDLQDALGMDVCRLGNPRTMFGFENTGWKPWTTFDGTPVLVPAGFNTEPEPNGDILMYPEGDSSVPPSGRMPKGGFYFEAIVRQEPIDEDRLDPQDNLEEFGPISDADLEYYAAESERLRSQSDRAILANFGGTAFGDIALVPAPWLKHPKGIRDVEEWYISTASRFDYVYEVFQRQCEIGLANLAKIYDAVGDRVSIVMVTGTDFGTQSGPFISPASYRKLYKPFHRRVNDWVHQHTPWKTFIHSCGSIVVLLPDIIEAGFDVLNPVQCSAVGMDPRMLKERFGSADVLGRRRRYAKDAALRHAGSDPQPGARADRDFRPGRRIRVQHGAQRPGSHADREPAGPIRGRAGNAGAGLVNGLLASSQ